MDEGEHVMDEEQRTLTAVEPASGSHQNADMEEIELNESEILNKDPTSSATKNNSGDSQLNDVESSPPLVTSLVMGCRESIHTSYTEHRSFFSFLIKTLFFLVFCVYLGFAFSYSFGDDQSITLLVLTLVGLAYHIQSRLSKRFGKTIEAKWTALMSISAMTPIIRKLLHWGFVTLAMTALVSYVLVDTALKRPRNLVSFLGILVFIGVMFVLSKRPDKVRWRTVVWGILLQFIFGLLVLRTKWGYASFQWLANMVTKYLNYTDKGSSFAFGEGFREHYFIFSVMPNIIFFSATISVLYYLGVMQIAINAITHVMRISLDTGPMETLHAAFNVFVGWAETIPVVQPLLPDMTLSELHAIMTNGFATVSGGAMAAYILYGAPANHLISASFMSAPAALALGKLFYPETVVGRRKQKTPVIPKFDNGIIEAASTGAVAVIPLIAYIVVHVIAFFSVLGFIDDTLAWIGARAGVTPPDYPVMSFKFISSYLLWPVAFLMGVEIKDCRVVARMLGVKVFVNEFIAFDDLGKVRRNNLVLQNYTSFFPNASWYSTVTDDVMLNATGVVLRGGVMTERSATIATYALCGFSDLVALAMMIGALSAVIPSRKREIIEVAPRALVSGVMACFLTAAMAGLLVD